jgi:hypothetical protein
MQAQLDALHVRVACLRLFFGSGYAAADATPQIDLVVQVDREGEVAPAVIGEVGQEIWLICLFAHRGYGGTHSDGSTQKLGATS